MTGRLCCSNQRTLDPAVLAASTVSNASALTTPAIVTKFEALWNFVENYRETHSPPPPPVPPTPIPPPEFNVSVFTYWFQNQPKELLVASLTGADICGEQAADRCVGTLANGACVCSGAPQQHAQFSTTTK